MAIRIPWDQYEAAYLLLVCIDVIENHTDRATAIKKVSEALRKRALHNGIEIDSMYRNENGISTVLLNYLWIQLNCTKKILKP